MISPPRFVRRCPDFGNRCHEFWWGERPREPRCPESKTSRPDLELPASDPANAGVRGEFLLGIFPPDHGGNHAPTPTPTPAATPAK